MGHPDRHNLYKATIRRMVLQALEEQDRLFEQEHSNDTDEELIAYLRSCAIRLQHSPWPREITGGRLLELRFGNWKAALSAAHLSSPCTPDQFHSFLRVQEEIERQKIVFRKNRAEKKKRAEIRKVKQAAKKKQSE